MEQKHIFSLTEEELSIILNRLALGTESFNKAVTQQNYMAVLEATDNTSLAKVSALYNKLLFNGSDENSAVVANALDSLTWLTKDCINEVKTLWALPRVDDDQPSPKIKAVMLIKKLGESNGFVVNLKKAAEIKDKILKM